jgi:hypothetical protein
LVKIFICFFALSFSFYSYLAQQNDVKRLRMMIPARSEQIRKLEEENMALSYQIEQFENPVHLMKLSKHPQFSHLKHPLIKDVEVIEGSVEIDLPALSKSAREESMQRYGSGGQGS